MALGNRSARVPPLPSLPTGDEQILDNSMFESLGTEVDEDDDLLNDNTSTISKSNRTQFDIQVDPYYKTKIRSNELSGTIQEWIDVSTGKEQQSTDKAMENLVSDYFRNVIFREVKFLNDYVVKNTNFTGPGYKGSMLDKLLRYVGKSSLSTAAKVKFWNQYAVIGMRSLDRQKSNKCSTVRCDFICGTLN